MIKAALVILTGFLAGPDNGSTGAGHDFLGGFPDVVLAPGFEEVSDERVVFDTGAGLIVETVLHGNAPAGEVLAFYDESLAQLGWRRVESAADSRAYVRADDRLELTTETDGKRLALRLFLHPAEAE